MQGYQITFFTQQDRRHDGMPLGKWILQQARALGVGGGTLIAAAEGFGHNGRFHSAHFFELADQPVEVILALGENEANKLFARLREARVKVFYVKTPVEFGEIGDEPD